MKKPLKIFLIILFNLIACFIITEFTCFYFDAYYNASQIEKNWKEYNIAKKVNFVIKNYKYSWLKHKNFDETYELIKTTRMRKPIGLQYKNKPILIMGCSFAYGYKLEEKDTFAYKISELMKRPVYNRAFEWWWGLQTMLYQARREDFYKEVPEPEYIIYIFIDDHISRINLSCIEPFFEYPHLRYKLYNNRLEREKFSQRYNLFMFRNYTRAREDSIFRKMKWVKLFNEFFLETKQEFDKHWKNYKFIILIYQNSDLIDFIYQNLNIKELKENGFIIIETKDLAGRVLDNPDTDIVLDGHPSAAVWTMLTPKLVERINNI